MVTFTIQTFTCVVVYITATSIRNHFTKVTYMPVSNMLIICCLYSYFMMWSAFS